MGGSRSGGRPSDRGESEGRLEGGEEGPGAESARKLAPRRATQMAAPYEKEKNKPIKPCWKIEIILIRSDSACQ